MRPCRRHWQQARIVLHCIAFQRGGAGGLWPKRTSSFPLREVQYFNKAVVPIGHHHLASLQFLKNTKAKNFRRLGSWTTCRVQAVTLSSSGNQQAAPKPLQAPTTKQTEGSHLVGRCLLGHHGDGRCSEHDASGLLYSKSACCACFIRSFNFEVCGALVLWLQRRSLQNPLVLHGPAESPQTGLLSLPNPSLENVEV